MSDSAYSVVTTSHFDRLLKKLVPRRHELVERFEEAIGILSIDPQNKSHMHPIKKLKGIASGEGQFRLRSATCGGANGLRLP